MIRLTITDPTGKAAGNAVMLFVHDNLANCTVNIQDAQLWWPIGYGKQPLYILSAELLRNVGQFRNTTRMRLRRIADRYLDREYVFM